MGCYLIVPLSGLFQLSSQPIIIPEVDLLQLYRSP